MFLQAYNIWSQSKECGIVMWIPWNPHVCAYAHVCMQDAMREGMGCIHTYTRTDTNDQSCEARLWAFCGKPSEGKEPIVPHLEDTCGLGA